MAEAAFRVALVGFGEAGRAFVEGWSGDVRPRAIAAFDVKTEDPATRAAMQARYAAHGVEGATSVGQAVGEASVVFSVVTAEEALAAAEAAAPWLPEGALWFDCNSCAPDTKRRAADVIHAAGGRYVDVAVMAPVHPKRHRVPLLVSGPHAGAAMEKLLCLGMAPREMGGEVGRASSIKMLRSVMIKGLEALTAECFLAARAAGVEAEVIASLEASDPDIRWRERGAYNLERMMVHGARRAAEMREVTKTVAALGLPSGMSAAASGWQDWVAALGVEPGADNLGARLDRVLAAR
jgi:3-hydroxyisobutyrate dehydrogenase-like beta-hydroxyacid dehydrogenase